VITIARNLKVEIALALQLKFVGNGPPKELAADSMEEQMKGMLVLRDNLDL
jgi:hypothetical protein